jgi:hypothetical protein
MATLSEIETQWSLLDVKLANEYLDAYEEAQAEADKRARDRAARGGR